MSVEKRGFRMPVSIELELSLSGFPRKGHWEEIPLTDADREAHARAVAAFAEVESNPWLEDLSYEGELRVKPLEPERRFVPEETHEEHVARWEAAGRPKLPRDSVERILLSRLMSNPGPGGASFGAAHALTRGEAA